MAIDHLIQLLLPISLMLIMFGLGLGLVPADFARILRQPAAVLAGMAAQFLLLPGIAIMLVWLLDLSPVLAAGLLILSFCPGGVTSNLFSYLARGDVPLSVSLTAINSVISPLLIPLLTAATLSVLTISGAVDLPILATMGRLLLVALVPLALGMLVRAWLPGPSIRAEKLVSPAALILMFVIIGAIVYDNRDGLLEMLSQTSAAVILLNVLSAAAGFGLAALLRLGRRQRFTLAIETGIQNASLALLVTGSFLGSSAMSVVPAMYGLLMFPVGFAVMLIGRRTLPPLPPPDAAMEPSI